MIKIGELTFSPIQYERLLISWVIIFAILTIIFLLMPLPSPITEAIMYGKGLLVGTIIIAVASVPLGWHLYKRFFHCIFTYNEDSFSFRKGRGYLLEGRWSDFTLVSLARSGYDFNIRLYKDEKEYVELPVSKVKLNPYDFRTKVTGFVSSRKGEA